MIEVAGWLQLLFQNHDYHSQVSGLGAAHVIYHISLRKSTIYK